MSHPLIIHTLPALPCPAPLAQVRSVRRRLQQSLGREPTPAEIAAAAGMSPEQVLRLEAAFRQPWSVVLEAESSESRGSEMEADDVVDADGQVREWVGWWDRAVHAPHVQHSRAGLGHPTLVQQLHLPTVRMLPLCPGPALRWCKSGSETTTLL